MTTNVSTMLHVTQNLVRLEYAWNNYPKSQEKLYRDVTMGFRITCVKTSPVQLTLSLELISVRVYSLQPKLFQFLVLKILTARA